MISCFQAPHIPLLCYLIIRIYVCFFFYFITHIAGLTTKSSLGGAVNNGAFYSNSKQFGVQLLGVLMCVVWPLLWTYFITWFVLFTVCRHHPQQPTLSVQLLSVLICIVSPFQLPSFITQLIICTLFPTDSPPNPNSGWSSSYWVISN